MEQHLLLLAGGILALYFGADWMVKGAVRLEHSLGVSPLVVGLTVVAFGTSAPELVVGVVAALKGSGDLVVGNVLGSNLANIGLILGVTAALNPLLVGDQVVRVETPIMLLLTVLLYPILMDFEVSRLEGALLVVLLGVYLAYLFRQASTAAGAQGFSSPVGGAARRRPRASVWLRDSALVVVGGISLVVGGRGIVSGATGLALALGVSELAIGLTVVAVGTSLPELATSVLAGLRKQTEIAVGNVIGSNIFNITGVLGASAMAKPFAVDARLLSVEFPAVLILSVLLLLVPVFPLGRTIYSVQRWEGAFFLAAYFGLATWVLTAR